MNRLIGPNVGSNQTIYSNLNSISFGFGFHLNYFKAINALIITKIMH